MIGFDVLNVSFRGSENRNSIEYNVSHIIYVNQITFVFFIFTSILCVFCSCIDVEFYLFQSHCADNLLWNCVSLEPNTPANGMHFRFTRLISFHWKCRLYMFACLPVSFCLIESNFYKNSANPYRQRCLLARSVCIYIHTHTLGNLFLFHFFYLHAKYRKFPVNYASLLLLRKFATSRVSMCLSICLHYVSFKLYSVGLLSIEFELMFAAFVWLYIFLAAHFAYNTHNFINNESNFQCYFTRTIQLTHLSNNILIVPSVKIQYCNQFFHRFKIYSDVFLFTLFVAVMWVM